MTKKSLELIENMISDVTKSLDSDTLMTNLGKISNYINEQIPNILESEKYDLAKELCKKVSDVYLVADQMIKDKQKFSTLKNFSKFFVSNAEYWNKKSDSIISEPAEGFWKMGLESQNTGKYLESLEYFNKALKIKPNSIYLIDKGNSFYALEKFHDAILCYDKALDIEPSNLAALCNKGLALANLNEFKHALVLFDEVIKANSNMESAFLGKGFACLKLGQYAESEMAYNAALHLNKKSIEAMLNLSSVYHRGFNDHTKAAEYAQMALEIEPNNTNAKANLSEFLLDSDYKKSAKLADEILQINPDQFGYPLRLVKTCSLYFSKETNEATKQAYDLLEYYKSINNKQILDWHFDGLKNIIKKSKISDLIKKTLYDFIILAETSDESKKYTILDRLPEQIKRSKGLLNSLIKYDLQYITKRKSRKNIVIKNTSSPDPNRPGWYNWEIHLEPKESLEYIKSVTYYLHKTFPTRTRECSDPNDGFRLSSSGWGEFQVKVEIHFKDETVMIKYHWLELGETPLDPEK